MNREWLVVVAPQSVAAWFSEFATDAADTFFVGETEADPRTLADQFEHRAAGRSIRIYSGHDSLLRDWVAAQELRRRGIVVESQSGMAVAAGLDKLLQKRLLSRAGIPTPAWGALESATLVDPNVLIKGREGTQSRGLVRGGGNEALPREPFWEEFVAGTEYSVVVHCNSRGRTVFPPIWKGDTREDLIPPWRRLRLVPATLMNALEKELCSTALAIVHLLDAWGFVEVEFIVPPSCPPLVIDINPRICGTLRIAAMSSKVKVFDLDEKSHLGDFFLTAKNFAAEVPFHGEPFVTPNAIATSRLTCAASTRDEVRAILARWSTSPLPQEWPEAWCGDRL